MNLTRLLENIRETQLRFGVREKAWAVILLAVGIAFWGNTALIRPRAKEAEAARASAEKAHKELMKLEAQRPNLEDRQARIRALQAELGKSFQELEDLEEGLLYRQDQDLLLQRLVAEREKYRLEINSVKPIKEKAGTKPKKGEQEPFYKRLFVEVDTFAGFEDLIGYVKLLENQGPYQRVQEVKVRIEKSAKALPRAVILLEVLLADAPARRQEMREQVFSLMEDLSAREGKDPFLARERPREEKEAAGMELSGIFGDGKQRSALIDGNVYQVGDLVQDKRIVEILPDKVILEKGDERFFLTEKQAAP